MLPYPLFLLSLDAVYSSLIKLLLGRQNALALVCLELCCKFLVSSGHDSGVALHLISRLQGKK